MIHPNHWLRSVQQGQLAPGEVHVWCAPLDGPADRAERMRRLLPTDEQQRADRFHFPHHRHRFTIARGVLRSLLGHYLGHAPETVQFRVGLHGKPALPDPARLLFNLSHSHELALVAVTESGPVGIDVEKVRPMPNAEQLAERYFSPRETARLRALAEDVRLSSFFRCWTRKEAYIKATGLGLSFPLDQFEVTLAPDEPAQLLHVEGDPAAKHRWSMHHLAPADDYVAALAVDGAVAAAQIRCFRLEL